MGSSGGIPDISVRLSAQGVQDVINAFTRVRQEAKTTGVETSASLELINTALGSMSELLPTITFAAIIAGAAKLASGALESADALGKLSEKTGAAIGTLSVLNLVAHDNDVSQESLGNGLVKLAKNMQDASQGAQKPAAAFKALGISVADLKNQDPGDLFVTVAQKLDAIPDGAQKAQIAIALFGKAGAELIPILNSLGVDGFDNALDKAKKLGIYLDGDMVAAAHAAHDSLLELEDIASGLSTRFIAGFAPGFTQGIEVVAEAFEGQGVDSVRKFGEFCADTFKGIIGAIELVGQTIKVVFQDAFAVAKSELGGIKATLQGLASGGVQGAIAGAVNYNATQGPALSATLKQNNDAYFASIQAFQAQLTAAPQRTLSKQKKGSGANGNDQANQDKLAEAQAAYDQSIADNELALLKTTNSLEEAEDKRHYDAGILTVDDYYDKVEDRVKAEAAAETAILQAKLESANNLPDTTDEQIYKKLTTINGIQTQIEQVALKSNAAIAAAEDDRFKAYEANQAKQLTDTEKLQKLTGDTFGAQETALQIEINDYAILLAAQGKSLEEINDATAAYKQRGQALIDFNIAQQSGSQAVSGLNSGIADIQNKAANGSISNVAAQTQILQLQQQTLATLAQIGQQMFVNAALSQNSGAIQSADAFLAANQKLAASLTNVTTAQTYLINQLSTQGISALTTFFTAGISGSKSFADALGDLADSFANIVAQMVSQLLIFYALTEILGIAGVDKGTITSIVGTSPFSKGHVDGGYTANVGKNQIAGVVHGGEWVATAAQTTQYRPLFDMIMNGTLDQAMATPTVIPKSAMAQIPADYAKSVTDSGGVIGASGGSNTPPPIVQVINGSGQPSKQSQKSSPGGQSITQIIIGAVATDIAKGGQIGQAMQSNYGVSRSGVKRGG